MSTFCVGISALIKSVHFSPVQGFQILAKTKVISQFGRRFCVKSLHKTPVITNVTAKEEILYVQTLERSMKFPWVWLRDNCQCPKCFNPQMQSRTIDWRLFDIEVKPNYFSGSDENLHIEWSDGHRSEYTLKWLKERDFNKDTQESWLKTVYKLPLTSWDSNTFPQIFKRFKYSSITERDSDLFEWLRNLATVGIAIIEDTPNKIDSVRLLANRVGFIKKTHYGEEFVVRNKPDTTNLAYRDIPLQMHTDMPYYEYKPGVNLLHCMSQTVSGGENQFCDGFHVAQWLKKTHPNEYSLLTHTPVEWADKGQETDAPFHTLYRAPVICEDTHGMLTRVNYNQWQRDSHFKAPLEHVKPWYSALKVFTQALYHPDNMVQIKAQPGQIVTFNNLRLLHGRSGYTDTDQSERHIIGAYLDWDIVHSRIRVLQNEFEGSHNKA